MASLNIGQVVATTLRNRMPDIVDNMSDNVPFYNRIRQRKNMKLDGGRDIVVPLEYEENGAFQFYSGYETLNVSINDIIDAAVFDWKQAAVPVSFSGLELLRNNGREAVIKIAAAKVKNAQRTFTNRMGAQVHADGTGSGGKEIGGLGLLVPTTVTNTVGGIDANVNTFWRSQVFDFSTIIGATTSSATIQNGMRRMYSSLMRNSDRPDLILASSTYYDMYWGSLTAIQRIAETGEGRGGFESLKFVNADVVNEGGVSGPMAESAVANATMFMLNTNYLGLITHSDRNIEVVGGERQSINQDATVQFMMWAGNMYISNRQLQGKGVE
jgi:hypothetical protein